MKMKMHTKVFIKKEDEINEKENKTESIFVND